MGSLKKPSGPMKLRSVHKKTKAHKDETKYDRKDEPKLKELLKIFAEIKRSKKGKK